MKAPAREDKSTSPWAPETIDLSTIDIVLLRQDPPFDMSYITTTHLLEHIHPKTFVVNDPGERAQRARLVRHPFRQRDAADLISADARAIRETFDEHQFIILKPLFGNGGAGVFRVRRTTNFNSLLEMFSQRSRRTGDRPALPAGGAQRGDKHHPDRR